MNLERLPAEKRVEFFPTFVPKATQAPLFPSLQPPEKKLTSPGMEAVLHQICVGGLIGELQVEAYFRRQLRRNCRPNTIRGGGKAILLFLEHLKASGCGSLSAISRQHISGFVEAEQDRGMAPRTVHVRLQCVYSFLGFLVRQEVIGADLLKRKLKIRLPDSLPRAMDPEDVQQLLAVIKKPREKALIVTLLRTGMRIGELLQTNVLDLNLSEKSIRIVEAQKNRVGRVVYLSSDAARALNRWLKLRERQSEYVFYGFKGGPLGYESARSIFNDCLQRAGLAHKDYTLHSLRHTYATELLNAGMPLQCLQELLGHRHIEMTRRYARLTDNTRREAYYRAMAIIEAGGVNGHYRCDYQLP